MSSIAAEFGRINFIKFRRVALICSGVLMMLSVTSLIFKGLNFGIDFTGGTLVELKFKQEADLPKLRNVFKTAFGLVQVSYFGSNDEVLVRVAPSKELSNAQISEQIIEIARQSSDTFEEVRRAEFVGPQVGEELTNDGGLAVLYALVSILIYIGFRFEWRFALGSVAALVHDVIITLGIFSLFEFNFDLTVLAAILAIIGYSLNDTVVVFDRIRERFVNLRKGTSEQVVNLSINDMLGRTLMTSLTTLLVLLALFFLGGEIINVFAIALIVGVIIGTYSSVYVAGSVSLLLGVSKEHFQLPEKEGKKGLSEYEMLRQQQEQLEQMRQANPERAQALANSAERDNSNQFSSNQLSSKRKSTKSNKKPKRKK